MSNHPGKPLFMRRALALARRGSGLTRPNPLVGAVLVKDNHIVGQGWHQVAGGPHAEVMALEQAGDKARGATLYVSLEPCNHFGKTPPCTEAIINAGVACVEVAMRDPNPHVKGGGVERLREAGVEVNFGLLAEQAREVNLAWSHWEVTGKPFVMLKLYLSLDGKIAYADGSARWLSSPISRVQVQRLRRYAAAVIIGADLVLADNPQLTNRSGCGGQPVRVIIDPGLSVPAGAQAYRPLGLDEKGTSPIALVVTTSKAGYEARRTLELHGVEVVVLENSRGCIDYEALIAMLGKRGIQTVMCEGGAEATAGLLCGGLCNRLLVYRVPVIVGPEGRALFPANGRTAEPFSSKLKLLWAKKLGLDALSVYEVL